MLCSVVIRGVGLVEYSLGDFSRGEAYLERLLKIVDPVVPRPGLEHTMLAATVPWVARITGVFNQLDVAATAAQTVLASPFPNPMYALISRAGLEFRLLENITPPCRQRIIQWLQLSL